MNKKKTKKKTSTVMLFVVCTMIILYAIANFILQYYTQVEVSPTLTKYWFGFWSAEVLALAGIKISKVFKKTDEDKEYEEE